MNRMFMVKANLHPAFWYVLHAVYKMRTRFMGLEGSFAFYYRLIPLKLWYLSCESVVQAALLTTYCLEWCVARVTGHLA